MGRARLFYSRWRASALAGSFPTDGEALFRDCEFKAAAHVFEHALTKEPGNARLHFWLGKSYARMAEVSVHCRHAGTRARHKHIWKQPPGSIPANREFLMELFELYVDSPEYFDGGLSRATAMLERLGPDDGGPGSPSRIVADARKEYSGRSGL